jgi:hypothetical protein
MSSHRSKLIDQILDENKTSWNKNDDAGGDGDVFLAEVVMPLRALRDDGLFERLREHRGSYRHGKSIIDRIDIIGAINYEWDIREE